MAILKSTVLTLCLTYCLVTVTAHVPVIVEEPEDQTRDEEVAVFMTCGVQYLDRTTHVVSWVLGSTIISDDARVRKNDLDALLGDGVSQRYLLTLGIIPEDPPNTPRQYNIELFITSAHGVDNGGEFRCAVCPKDNDGICNGNLEYESRVATLEVRYGPDTTLYPECINPSNSPTDTVVVLGVQSTLTCESEIANPPVNLQWRKNGQIVESTTLPVDTVGIRRLDLNITPVYSDEGSIFTCTITSDYFNDLTNTECRLPPIKVTVQSPVEVITGRPTLEPNRGSNGESSAASNEELPTERCITVRPRRTYLSQLGTPYLFKGWVDVQGQGANNDYCRIITNAGRPQYLSCALAGSTGNAAYTSPAGYFDAGHTDTWYMKDADGDGRDDYCRCVGLPPNTVVSCLKAGEGGFTSDFQIPDSNGCHYRKVDPFFGEPINCAA
ncbi:uncharacterized protein [Amphiura filiformis]|uniref:uncharacterized protein n=1 Tax=Amphiura filiformis TaxID=82378 RepID=UPI003B21B1DD